MKDLKTYLNESKKSMKYTIELGARAQGVRLLELTEEEKNELLNEDLDEVYEDWIDRKDYEFALAGLYLMPDVDRFTIVIKDENGDVVFESADVRELLEQDKTYDEYDDEILAKKWEFAGVKDGLYLTRIQTVKGAWFIGEFELNEPFDKDKIYIVRDKEIDDELLGDNVYPIDTLYYQRSDDYDVSRDKIHLEDESEIIEEQYFETRLFELVEGDCWHDLQE